MKNIYNNKRYDFYKSALTTLKATIISLTILLATNAIFGFALADTSRTRIIGISMTNGSYYFILPITILLIAFLYTKNIFVLYTENLPDIDLNDHAFLLEIAQKDKTWGTANVILFNNKTEKFSYFITKKDYLILKKNYKDCIFLLGEDL